MSTFSKIAKRVQEQRDQTRALRPQGGSSANSITDTQGERVATYSFDPYVASDYTGTQQKPVYETRPYNDVITTYSFDPYTSSDYTRVQPKPVSYDQSAYWDDLRAQGMNEDEIAEIRQGRRRPHILDVLTQDQSGGQYADYNPYAHDAMIDLDPGVTRATNTPNRVWETIGPGLDEGVDPTYDSITSDYMTGTAYMHYRDDLGMGGREVIDPYGVYSKTEEQANHGFHPFHVDDESTMDRNLAWLGSSIGKAGTNLATAREDNPVADAIPFFSYMIDLKDDHGNVTTVNGSDFEKLWQTYYDNIMYERDQHPETFLSKPEGDQPYTLYVNEWRVDHPDGRHTYHYGTWNQDPDTGDVIFSDGSRVRLDYIEGDLTPNGTIPIQEAHHAPDARQLSSIISASDPSDMTTWGAMYIPDLDVNGTRLTFFEVSDMLTDGTDRDEDGELGGQVGDRDMSYRFGIGNLLKPSRLVDRDLVRYDPEEGLSFNVSSLRDAAPNLLDMTAGSMPISSPAPIAWTYSASQAIPAMSGVDPSSYRGGEGYYSRMSAGYMDDNGMMRYGVDPDSIYETNAEGRSNDIRLANTMGNLLVPLTEELVGPVGKGPISFAKLLGARMPQSTLGRYALGGIEEGIEEIGGNVFEDWQQNGIDGMLTPAHTVDGDTVTDATGREIRYGSPIPVSDRVGYFFLDPSQIAANANAFTGGFSVASMMGGGHMLPNYRPFGREARIKARQKYFADRGYIGNDMGFFDYFHKAFHPTYVTETDEQQQEAEDGTTQQTPPQPLDSTIFERGI